MYIYSVHTRWLHLYVSVQSCPYIQYETLHEFIHTGIFWFLESRTRKRQTRKLRILKILPALVFQSPNRNNYSSVPTSHHFFGKCRDSPLFISVHSKLQLRLATLTQTAQKEASYIAIITLPHRLFYRVKGHLYWKYILASVFPAFDTCITIYSANFRFVLEWN